MNDLWQAFTELKNAHIEEVRRLFSIPPYMLDLSFCVHNNPDGVCIWCQNDKVMQQVAAASRVVRAHTHGRDAWAHAHVDLRARVNARVAPIIVQPATPQ